MIDKKAEKPLIDRINMGRLFLFNIFACIGVLLITGIFALFKVKLFESQSLLFLSFAGILGLSVPTVYLTVRTKQRQMFDKVSYGYLGVICACMYAFAFCAETVSTSIVFFWIMMMIIGILTIMDTTHALVVHTVAVIPMVILLVIKPASSESVLSVISITVMSYFLSTITYTSTVKKLSYKLSLDQAVNQAETDPMTTLLNRRGLERRLETLWPMAIRQNTGVAVLMLDIDNFKKYNDTFGHPEGDECIRKVTGAMKRAVKRRTDYAARVGGEEFLVLLTNIDPKSAVKWALELKRSVEEMRIPHAPSNFSKIVTVSMGLACADVEEGITFEELKEQADKALYDAKFNGRARLYYNHRCYGNLQVADYSRERLEKRPLSESGQTDNEVKVM